MKNLIYAISFGLCLMVASTLKPLIIRSDVKWGPGTIYVSGTLHDYTSNQVALDPSLAEKNNQSAIELPQLVVDVPSEKTATLSWGSAFDDKIKTKYVNILISRDNHVSATEFEGSKFNGIRVYGAKPADMDIEPIVSKPAK